MSRILLFAASFLGVFGGFDWSSRDLAQAWFDGAAAGFKSAFEVDGPAPDLADDLFSENVLDCNWWGCFHVCVLKGVFILAHL